MRSIIEFPRRISHEGLLNSPPNQTPPILEDFVYQYGHQSDSYLATAPNRRIFWSSNHRGLVSYQQYGRHLLVAGGLIAPPEERRGLLLEFMQYAAQNRWRPVFFCIVPEDAPLFQQTGWHLNKIGEEPFLPLDSLQFSGKSYEWVRRQVNFCQRHGVEFEEVFPDQLNEQDWTHLFRELLLVTRQTMEEKVQTGELTFFDGSIEQHELGCRRLFIAHTTTNGLRRIEGYVVCNPILGGKSWSTEIYRHRRDAVRGTVPFLFHQIAARLKEEQAAELKLCLVPTRNCEQPLPNDKAFIRHAIRLFRRCGTVFFDVHGQDHFKSRFRPMYHDCYLCTPPGRSLMGVLATLHAFGLFRVSPVKLLQQSFRRWRKR